MQSTWERPPAPQVRASSPEQQPASGTVGQRWLPGGEPVRLARNLLVGEDAEMGSEDRQLRGRVDDVLVLGVALSADDVKAIATEGAEAFFNAHPDLLKTTAK